MKDALDRGVPIREIARELGVDEKTVRNWAKKASARKVERATPPAPSVDEAVVVAAMSAPLPSADEPGALSMVRDRHELIRGLIERLAPAVETEEYPATSFVTVCKYGDDLARFIAELTPPAPKDPNDDPNVIDSESILFARVEKLVSDREAQAK